MLFKETGNKESPTIILLHGGGLSWWSLKCIAEILQSDYHVVTPIIDGHGENGEETFISIEDSAKKLLDYIDSQCQGKVFALSGLSIGAQIVTEVISLREDIAQYTIIESSLVYPIKGTTALTVPTYKLCYGLVRKKWFAKMQAKTLFVPQNMFEQYYTDSLKISKESLINITLSNGNYQLRNEIVKTKSKVLIIVGEKELGIMKKSAKYLHEKIANSQLYVIPQMGHGEISLVHPIEYVNIVKTFFTK
jgi:pimeloyl-ACP methyl ester carboxylesterase